jgi:hypothetical protein
MITMRDWLLWTSTLLVPGIGHACSCMPEGPVSSIELGTSVIFRGIVTEVTFNPNADPHRAYRVRFAVKEMFSGDPKPEEETAQGRRGTNEITPTGGEVTYNPVF